MPRIRLGRLYAGRPEDGGTPSLPSPVVGTVGRLVQRWVPEPVAAPPPEAGVRSWRRRLAVPAVVVGVFAAALTAVVLASGRPDPERAPPLPLASREEPAAARSSAAVRAEEPLVVSVIGKVRKPGLVTVPAGARVADALEAAGGARPGTDLSSLNLARKVTDGEQIHAGAPAPAASGTESGANPVKVDLNTATREQLESLPGVGEVTAQRILDWRTRHGGFTAIEQLREVDGIGERRLATLREYVTVG